MLEDRVELEAKNRGLGLPADMCKVGREGGGIFHHLISFKNIGFDVFIFFEPQITKLILGHTQ